MLGRVRGHGQQAGQGMSQRILGLDIGSSSVKAVVLETSFRSFQLVSFAERSVRDVPDESERDARKEVLRQMVATGEARAEVVMCALPGDKVMSRILALPFGEPKRIEAVLGFELESFLPMGVDQMVYDYQILHRGEDKTTVLAAAVQRTFLSEFLEDLKEIGLDPKIVSLDSLSYLNLWEHLKRTAPGPVAIVDVGARTTQVCVLEDGRAQLVRTMRVAGDAVTAALARSLEVEWAEAERIKCDRGLLPASGMALSPDDRRIADACAEGVKPLLRDLRQTFQAYLAQSGREGIGRVLLCGGSSRLLGVQEHLEEQLGVDVELLDVASTDFNKLADPTAGAGIIQKALALSLRAVGGRSHSDLNFRQGPYAYQGDFQFLRDKTFYLIALALMLMGVAGFKAYARYRVLDDRRQAQVVELAKFSKEVLGKERDDYDAVLRTLGDVPDVEDLRIFPEVSATQVFYDITSALQSVNYTSKADLAQAVVGGKAASRPAAGALPGAEGDEGRAPAPIRPPGPAQADLPISVEDRAARLERLREARDAAEATGRLHTTRGPDLERLRAERLQQLRGGQVGTGVGGMAAPARGVVLPPTPTVLPPAPAIPGASVRANRDAVRVAEEPRGALAAPGAMPRDGEVRPEGEAPPAEGGAPANDNLQVELEEVRIEESSAYVKGQANTIEALELFAQRLEAHRCLRDVVTADTDKVTFARHQGWLMFKLEMALDCRDPKKAAKKDKKTGEAE